ncbi:MAG: hypothetical protein P4L42_15060 [Desulfocapsaceae bacterium]|nr:hypothetical protein [Desulfocapsaceae bacterium]
MVTKNFFKRLILIISILSLTGCAGSNKYMKEVSGEAIKTTPNKEEVSVIFMRPSGFGFAISSSVFDLTGDTDTFVGIVSAKKKIVYKTKPGEHMFMVIGESADFMKADLRGEKIYYVLVTPRMGVWKARFSLQPVSRSELSSADFNDWVNSCTYTENTDDSYTWAKDNAPSIQSKKSEYLPEWYKKSESDRPFLKAEDAL